MSLLDALGWVGESVAKPGRVVRGLLGDRPDEALNVIPFSDTFGLTDPSRQVHGRDLLRQIGWQDDGEGDYGGAVAGFGVDVLTDPLTWAGGALLSGGAKLLSKAAPSRLGAVAGSDAANGLFHLDDPISRLMPETEAVARANRGATSPWSDTSWLDDAIPPGTRAPERIAPPPPAPPGQYDELFPPSDHLTHYGSDYSLPQYQGTKEWGNSYANDVLMDGRPEEAFGVAMGTWDRALDDLERLSPAARAKLIGDGAGSAGNSEWQALMHQRRADLEAVRKLAANGVVPTSYWGQADSQLARLEPLSTWSTEGTNTASFVNDLSRGYHPPSRATEVFQENLGFLPHDPRELRRFAAKAQDRSMRETIAGQLRSIINPGDGLPVEALTPSAVDNLAELYQPQYLRQRLDHLIDPQAWTDLEYIEPNIARRVLAEGPETETGALVAALRRLMDNSRHRTLFPGDNADDVFRGGPWGDDLNDGVIELQDFA